MEDLNIVELVTNLGGLVAVLFIWGRKAIGQLRKDSGTTLISSLVEQIKKLEDVDLDGDGKPDTEVLLGLLQRQVAQGVKAGMVEITKRLDVLEQTVERLVETIDLLIEENDQAKKKLAEHSKTIGKLAGEVIGDSGDDLRPPLRNAAQ